MATRDSSDNCPTLDNLRLYVWGEMPPADSDLIDSHLEECEHCVASVEHLEEETDFGLGRIAKGHVSDDLPVNETGFLSQLCALPGMALTAPVRGNAEAPGELLLPSRFELIEELATGGMGVIWRAFDKELQRTIAIKIIRRDRFSNDEFIHRFRREASICSRLEHPSIVPIHDLGAYGDTHFIAMKLVEGKTLAELLHDGTESQLQLLTVFQQTCEAIAFAHANGVIHRDLKPANIMVGRFGEVQVMDWGLSRVLSDENGAVQDAGLIETGIVIPDTVSSTADRFETMAGTVLGTPAYMAPEQAEATGATDKSSDVFSLGVILCEILTGAPLSRAGENGRAFDVDATSRRVSDCGADAELIQLCLDCLSANQKDRLQDAGQVLQRIDSYRSSVEQRVRSADSKRAVAETRAHEERKRRRVVGFASLGVLLMLVVSALVVADNWQKSKKREIEAAKQGEARKARENRIDTNLSDLTNRLHEIQCGRGDHQALTTANELLKRQQKDISDSSSTRRPEWEASLSDIKTTLDHLASEFNLLSALQHYWIHDHRLSSDGQLLSDYAEDGYVKAFTEFGLSPVDVSPEEAADRLSTAMPDVLAHAISALIRWEMISLQNPDNKPWINKLISIIDTNEMRGQVRSAIHGGDVEHLRRLAASNDILKVGPATVQLVHERLHPHDKELAVTLLRRAVTVYHNDFYLRSNLAAVLDREGSASSKEEAIRYLHAAFSLEPENTIVAFRLARHYEERGEFGLAIQVLQYTLPTNPNHDLLLRERKRFEERLAAKQEGFDPHAHTKLAVDAANSQDFERAIHEFTSVVDYWEKQPKRDAFQLARAWAHLGLAHRQNGTIDKALAAYDNAIEVKPDYAPAYGLRSVALQKQGRLHAARSAALRSVQVDPGFIDGHVNLAYCYFESAQFSDMEDSCRAALRIGNSSSAWTNLGVALRLMGRLKEAENATRRAIEIEQESAQLRYELARLLVEQGRFIEAAGEAKAAAEIDTSKLQTEGIETANRLADIETTRNAQVIRETVKNHSAEELSDMGLYCLYKGAPEIAVRYYRKLSEAPERDGIGSEWQFSAATAVNRALVAEQELAQRQELLSLAANWLEADIDALFDKAKELTTTDPELARATARRLVRKDWDAFWCDMDLQIPGELLPRFKTLHDGYERILTAAREGVPAKK